MMYSHLTGQFLPSPNVLSISEDLAALCPFRCYLLDRCVPRGTGEHTLRANLNTQAAFFDT